MPNFGFKYAAITGQFQQAMDAAQNTIATAATGAIKDVANYAKLAGRANIANAGFSTRWQNAFRANIYPSKGVSLNPAAFIFHRIPYAGIFENGGTIAGSPLLWLPLPNVPTSMSGSGRGSAHMTPANYVRLIGPLVTIYRPGRIPLLGGYMAGSGNITVAKLISGNRAMKRTLPGSPGAKVQLVPLFFGLDKVNLVKRFDLAPIFQKAQSMLGEAYLRNLKA